jgi:hypothetical protein
MATAYLDMYNRLQQEYKSKEKTAEIRLHHPELGMPVAAISHLDRKWYRAQIVKIHEESWCVDVVFVDYGNTETVDYSLGELCYLKKEFFYDDVSVS